MKKLILLLIPLLLFMTSCTIEKSTIHTLSPDKIQVHDKIPNNATQNTKSLGSGFTLSQTEDETLLSYSGKTIKTWSHTPPQEVPFIWDEACSIVWKGFEKLTPENQSTGKQGVWDALTEKEKKACIKEGLSNSIVVESYKNDYNPNYVSKRFVIIIRNYYETGDIWIFDTKNQIILPGQFNGFDIKNMIDTDKYLILQLEAGYDSDDKIVIYNHDGSELLQEWKAGKAYTTRINSMNIKSNILTINGNEVVSGEPAVSYQIQLPQLP